MRMPSLQSNAEGPKRQRLLSQFRSDLPIVALSAVLTSVAAVAEAGALILVVSLAEVLAGGEPSRVESSFGPFNLDLTFGQGIAASSLLLVAAATGRIVANYITIRRRTELTRQWRYELAAGFLGSSFEYESSRRKGQILETTGKQADQGAQVIDLMAMTLNSVLTMIILTGASFALDPVVASILLLGGGLLLLLLRPFSRRVRQLSATVTRLDVNLGNDVDELSRVARDIKMFGASHEFLGRTTRTADRSARFDRRRQVYARSVPILYQVLGLLLLLAAIGFAFVRGGTSLTAMGGAALLLLRGISYGQRVSTYQQGIATKAPFVDSVKDQLDDYSRNAERFGNATLERVGSIEFDGVSYLYPGNEAPAVDDVRLTVKDPGITGLVGVSGSGKSTLAQLLLRLRLPSDGQVLVNGVDYKDYAFGSWQKTVSFVPQEAELIHGTVMDNIAFFRDWITREDVETAAEAVGLSEHILSLPDGFESEIGPSVRDFSGGQKQRIGIARALAGKPSLFVLDEPTSALDNESEEWVMRTLRRLRSTSIVIVITHRESTMDHCDTLIRLESGRIVAA
jgi:ATP-binding cassette subfamily B protein